MFREDQPLRQEVYDQSYGPGRPVSRREYQKRLQMLALVITLIMVAIVTGLIIAEEQMQQRQDRARAASVATASATATRTSATLSTLIDSPVVGSNAASNSAQDGGMAVESEAAGGDFGPIIQ